MTRGLVLAAWCVVALLFVLAELSSRTSGRPPSHFRALLQRATATNGRLLAVFVGWMWVGWHFFAR